MLQLKNRTPFKASLMLLPDRDGVDTLFAAVKGTFALEPRLSLADEQVPVSLADQYHGDPAASSIKVPSDVCLGKPGTDVLLVGTAWAPRGAPTWQMDVSLAAGPLSRTVRVFGDRAWDSGPGGASMTWLEPFVRMPLVWERAFGGADLTQRGPVVDQRNPVGVGFRTSGGSTPVAGQRLPNVEDPAALISSPGDAPSPAGFAPVAPHWEPRKSYVGTYDEAWQANRSPYLPVDFDPRFFQVAPLGLSAHGHFRGDEVIAVIGATPAGLLQFQLPAVRPAVTYRLTRSAETRPAALETILIEPDAGRVVLTWRASLRCDKRALKIREVEPVLVAA